MKLTIQSILEITRKTKESYPNMLKDIEETLQINDANYRQGSDFSLENGYGFQIYLVMSLQEYLELALSINLFNASFLETEDKLYEEDNSYYIRQLFLSSSDSGYVIYIKL